jgi:hypothetical protein
MPRETSALLLQPRGGEQTNAARFFNRFRCSDFNYWTAYLINNPTAVIWVAECCQLMW